MRTKAQPQPLLSQFAPVPHRMLTAKAMGVGLLDALPIANRRYGRLQICATPVRAVVKTMGVTLLDLLPIPNRRYGRLQICATPVRAVAGFYKHASSVGFAFQVWSLGLQSVIPSPRAKC